MVINLGAFMALLLFFATKLMVRMINDITNCKRLHLGFVS